MSKAIATQGKGRRKWYQIAWAQRQLIVLSLPILFLVAFNYAPLWGWIIAFQKYKPSSKIGLFEQPFVGLDNFKELFADPDFFRALKNSLGIGVIKIVFSYVFTLLLAVMINEVRIAWFKRAVQTISYLPHFVSWVVAANLVFVTFAPETGIINALLLRFGVIEQSVPFMGIPGLFWLVVALSEVWKSAGYGAIIYLSAMTAIDPELYESASIDGAGRLRKIFAITLPCITPTIKVLLVMSIGRLLNVGFEQVYLLRTAMTMSTGTTLEIYIYEFALRYAQFSKGTAMGIFNSLVSVVLITVANLIARKIDGEGII